MSSDVSVLNLRQRINMSSTGMSMKLAAAHDWTPIISRGVRCHMRVGVKNDACDLSSEVPIPDAWLMIPPPVRLP